MTPHEFVEEAGVIDVTHFGEQSPDYICRSAELICIPRVPFALVLPG